MYNKSAKCHRNQHQIGELCPGIRSCSAGAYVLCISFCWWSFSSFSLQQKGLCLCWSFATSCLCDVNIPVSTYVCRVLFAVLWETNFYDITVISTLCIHVPAGEQRTWANAAQSSNNFQRTINKYTKIYAPATPLFPPKKILSLHLSLLLPTLCRMPVQRR